MRLVRVRDAPRRGVRIGKRALTVHMRSGVVHGDAALGVALAYGGGCGERNAPLRLRSPLTAGVRRGSVLFDSARVSPPAWRRQRTRSIGCERDYRRVVRQPRRLFGRDRNRKIAAIFATAADASNVRY
jgi:hypothetical protein